MADRPTRPEAEPSGIGSDLTPAQIAALKEAFWDWYGLNDRSLYDGDTGDVAQLYHMLRMAAANSIKEEIEAPYSS